LVEIRGGQKIISVFADKELSEDKIK